MGTDFLPAIVKIKASIVKHHKKIHFTLEENSRVKFFPRKSGLT